MFDRIRLTYKQHRFETIAVAVICLAATVWALIDVWRLNSVGVPASCLVDGHVPYWNGPGSWAPGAGPTGVCLSASERFTEVLNGWDLRLITSLGDLLRLSSGSSSARRSWPGKSRREPRPFPGRWRALPGSGWPARFLRALF